LPVGEGVLEYQGSFRLVSFKSGNGVVSCHLSFGKLLLNFGYLFAQVRVCSDTLLEARNGFTNNCVVQISNQPAQVRQTQPSGASAQPKRGVATPITVQLGELIPTQPFDQLQSGHDLLPTGCAPVRA
jgi:hypothetical protein